MATLYAKGELPLDTEYINEGIIGTQFKGKLLREVQLGDFLAVEPSSPEQLTSPVCSSLSSIPMIRSNTVSWSVRN